MPAIMRTRPAVSNSRLSSRAPRKLLAAKAAMYQPVCLTPRKVFSVSPKVKKKALYKNAWPMKSAKQSSVRRG